MSVLMMKLLGQVYRAPEDDGAGGGGGAADRGDDYVPDDKGAADDKGAVDGKGAAGGNDDQEGQDDQGDQDDQDGDDDDDQPRNKDGKFAKKGDKGVMIPKARFDEVNRKAREREAAMQARIAELEKASAREVQQQDTAKLEQEVEDLEEQYQKFLDDGETAKAKDIMRQIRLKERQIVTMEAEHKSDRARTMAIEQLKFDTLVEKLEAEYPLLNPDHDDFDQEKVDEVVFLRQSFEKGGLSSTAALAKAVKYVLGDAPKKDDAKDDRRGMGSDTSKVDARRQKQLEKNIDVAKKQPSKMDAAGVDSNKKGGGIDDKAISDMSEEDFNALPEATKARLRGDFVADVS